MNHEPRTALRLFVAIDPSPQNVELFGQTIESLRPHAPKAKWAHPAKLHVTLAFLGHVVESKIVDVSQAIQFVATQHSPFLLRFEGGGTFGGKNRARVLWVGVSGDVPILRTMQTMLSEKLAPIGYEPEHRDFSPHLTFARSADPRGDEALAKCASLLEGQTFGETMVRELVLYRSELSSRGATYTALLRQSFGATIVTKNSAAEEVD